VDVLPANQVGPDHVAVAERVELVERVEVARAGVLAQSGRKGSRLNFRGPPESLSVVTTEFGPIALLAVDRIVQHELR
jgi:hypothetical protein